MYRVIFDRICFLAFARHLNSQLSFPALLYVAFESFEDAIGNLFVGVNFVAPFYEETFHVFLTNNFHFSSS